MTAFTTGQGKMEPKNEPRFLIVSELYTQKRDVTSWYECVTYNGHGAYGRRDRRQRIWSNALSPEETDGQMDSDSNRFDHSSQVEHEFRFTT